jgi:hypothetical protein
LSSSLSFSTQALPPVWDEREIIIILKRTTL